MKTLLIGINSKYIHPAMGVFQIYANSTTPCEYKEFTIKDDLKSILDYINNKQFDLLGFSVYIWNTSFIQTIISYLTHVNTIVLGGPEASYGYSDFLRFPNVHYIIKDEGEEAFNLLIESLQTNKDLNNIPNLYYRKNNAFIFTFSKNANIKKIKYDYSLIKDFKNRVLYLEASRGCCFKCAYCLASLEKGIRYLDLNAVQNHILYALQKGARVIKFLDRSFNIKQEFMRSILKFIQEKDNYYTSYQFEIVGDQLDNQTIELIKTIRKGLIRFEIGIQSLNPKTTKAVNRTQNIDKLINNINTIRNNIVLHLDLIAGLPYEDKTSFINTFNKTFMIFADELQLGFLKELRGTQISITKDIHEYIFSSTPPYEVIENKYITSEELNEIRLVEAGLNKFYNSSNFPKTNSYLFNELNLNPYYTFLNLTKYIGIQKINKLQIADSTSKFYDFLSTIIEDKSYLLYLIKQDYLFKFKMRPKIFWAQQITRAKRGEMYAKYIKKYPHLTLDILYRYAHLEVFQNQSFIVIYKPAREILYLNIKEKA